jgi:hypothetical protein
VNGSVTAEPIAVRIQSLYCGRATRKWRLSRLFPLIRKAHDFMPDSLQNTLTPLSAFTDVPYAATSAAGLRVAATQALRD